MKVIRLIFLYIFIMLGANSGISQIHVDSNLKNRFEESVLNAPDEVKDRYFKLDELMNSGLNGIVFIQKMTVDTSDFDKYSNKSEVEIVEMSTVDSIVMADNQSSVNNFLFCSGILFNDSLVMNLGYPFSSERITHVIHNGKVCTQFVASSEYDNLYKLYEHDSLAAEVQVPVVLEDFSMSDSVYLHDMILYGSVKLTTKEYYKKIEHKFIKLRWRIEYLFKCILKKV
ncbi:MAG: hypothetical protein AAF990_04330 [Bacteroidota bacterium]